MIDSRTFTFISDGKVPQDIGVAVRNAVAASLGKKLSLTLAVAKKRSTDKQRGYYFEVIVPAWQKLLREGTDRHWDKDDTHDYLMTEIGQWFHEPVMVRGKQILRRRSYMDLSTIEAEEHHAKCRAAAAEEGVTIMEPNEYMER